MLNRALRLRPNARAICSSMFRGQTMAEYALIVVAIAIVVLLAYQLMGQEISAAVIAVDTTITSASTN